jgi:subtilase family serine protease
VQPPAPPPTTPPVIDPPPPPAPKPDLVISAMGYDDPVKYFFTVTNQGAVAAGPFTVDIPGEGSFPIAGLAPGASATRTFRMACKVATETATADALGQVAETNEANNTRSFTETICIV